MTIFLSGGCKNGKSTIAERCAVKLSNRGPLYYIATMIPHDEEDHARIRRHVESRFGAGFETIEQGVNLLEVLHKADPKGTFLLDSVTALLSNEMFPGPVFDPEAGERLARELEIFVRSVKNAVFVSDFLYADAGGYDAWTETYRKGLALCDKTLARCCDAVGEVFSGNHLMYKGELPL